MPQDVATAVRPGDADAPQVRGALFYLRPSREKPYLYTWPQPDGRPLTNIAYDEHRPAIRDARPLVRDLSLDREGFTLLHHRSAVGDFYDEADLDGAAHAEAAAIVGRATGASRVEVFDHTLRRRTPDVPDRTPGIPRQPVNRVHNDYTEASGPQRVRDLLGAGADGLLRRRFAFINVWRPLHGPVVDMPLAVCDARSVAPQDFVATDLIYPDRRGEIYNVTHSPEHRWSYFPRMQTDEVLLIKCYNSRTDVARFVAHAAFDDPATPPDAPPRESIEIRTVAFFD